MLIETDRCSFLKYTPSLHRIQLYRQDNILMCWLHDNLNSIMGINSFYVLFAWSKRTKKSRLYKVLMIFYVRFLPRHASRSPWKGIQIFDVGTWLTSAWLANAPRTKTFLENLLKLYKVSPF
jgi:hypothetical protein